MFACIHACIKNLRVLENTKASALYIIGVVVFVSLSRTILEYMAGALHPDTLQIVFMHTLLFYAGTLFLYGGVVAYLVPSVPQFNKLFVLSVGIGVLPPLIDLVLPFADGRLYRYFDEPVWHFFTLTQAIGESITLWVLVVCFAVYVGYKRRSIAYGCIGFCIAYALTQLVFWGATEPATYIRSLLIDARPVVAFKTFSQLSVSFVWAVVALVMVVLVRFGAFRATLHRVHHATLFGTLVLFGAMLGGVFDAVVALKACIFGIAFFLMLAENDFYDKELDAKTGRMSHINSDDLVFVRFFMAGFLSLFLFTDGAFTVFLAVFFMLGLVYHHPAVRLKRHFVTGSIIEGLLALTAISAGLYQSTNIVTSTHVVFACSAAVLFGLFSNIRDYKDVAGDDSMNIRTLYVLLHRHGIPAWKTHAVFVISILLATTLMLMVALPLISALVYFVVACTLTFLLILALLLLSSPRTATTLVILHANVCIAFLAFTIAPLLNALSV